MSKVDSKKKRMTYADYKKIPDYAPTGCLLLDLVAGGGEGLGFPYGVMVNLVGDKSAGKTFLAWEIVAANYYKYKKRLKWNYDDAETGNTFNTKKLYGVDLLNHDQCFGKKSELVEEFDGNTSLFLKEIRSVNQRGIYVEDSLDGLSDADKEKQDAAFEKAAKEGKSKEGSGSFNTGTASHLSKQYFRTKVAKLARKKVLLVIVSQVREKINAGTFEKKTYRAGGKAMDFYAHSCLWLMTAFKIKKDIKVRGVTKTKNIGAVVKVVSEKSKTPRPYRSCYLSFYFDYGFDDIGSSIDYLFDLRTVKEQKLTSAAHNIVWNGSSVPRKIKNMTAWLKEIDLYDTLKEAKKADTGKAALSMEWCEEYLDDNPELKKKADEYFGIGMERDDLISMIEDDPKMYEELCERVVDRWEEEEEAAQSCRKGKYS